MAQDIDIYHINHHGLLIGTLDNITVDAPIGTIMKIEGIYIKCMASTHSVKDCHICACQMHNLAIPGLCATLLCSANNRDDRTEAYFEVTDINEETREEGRA